MFFSGDSSALKVTPIPDTRKYFSNFPGLADHLLSRAFTNALEEWVLGDNGSLQLRSEVPVEATRAGSWRIKMSMAAYMGYLVQKGEEDDACYQLAEDLNVLSMHAPVVGHLATFMSVPVEFPTECSFVLLYPHLLMRDKDAYKLYEKGLVRSLRREGSRPPALNPEIVDRVIDEVSEAMNQRAMAAVTAVARAEAAEKRAVSAMAELQKAVADLKAVSSGVLHAGKKE